MAASDVAKRSVIQKCKFRPLARLVQHKEARASIARWLRDGSGDRRALTAEASRIRRKIADSDFDADVNEHNAGYVEAFQEVCDALDMPACEMDTLSGKVTINMNGLSVRYAPDLILRRIARNNVAKIGAMFLIYSKGKSASVEEALHLSALSFGYLEDAPIAQDCEADKAICLSVCAYSGNVYAAPGNSKRRFNNMMAAGATIADLWPAIPAPRNARLA
ncbi:hypothetical protein [Methylobacterium sp. D54C]